MTEINKVALARQKMQEWHQGQTRWDKKTPYSVHPEKVVQILTSFGITDADIICAAYLHDVLEDTEITYEPIKELFGDNVLKLVQELTYPEECSDQQYWDWTKVVLSPQAKLIKTADILANLTENERLSPHFIAKRIKALRIMWQPERM